MRIFLPQSVFFSLQSCWYGPSRPENQVAQSSIWGRLKIDLGPWTFFSFHWLSSFYLNRHILWWEGHHHLFGLADGQLQAGSATQQSAAEQVHGPERGWTTASSAIFTEWHLGCVHLHSSMRGMKRMWSGMEPGEVVRRSEMLLLIWTWNSVGEKVQDEMTAHIKVLVESLYWPYQHLCVSGMKYQRVKWVINEAHVCVCEDHAALRHEHLQGADSSTQDLD